MNGNADVPIALTLLAVNLAATLWAFSAVYLSFKRDGRGA